MKLFHVWSEENGDREDAISIMAHDHEDAAALFGRKSDFKSADYSIANGNPVEVFVAIGNDKPEKFIVSAEPDIHYTARPA